MTRFRKHSSVVTLGEWKFFTLEKTERRLLVWYEKECKKGCYKKKDNQLFSTSIIPETRNNWHNLQQRRFKLDIRRFCPPQLLIITVGWNRLHWNEAYVLRGGFWDWPMQGLSEGQSNYSCSHQTWGGWMRWSVEDTSRTMCLWLHLFCKPLDGWSPHWARLKPLLVQIPTEITGHFLVT